MASEALVVESSSVSLEAIDGHASRDGQFLLGALRRAESWARDELVRRFGAHLERVLVRTLGRDAEIPDILQDVYVAAFAGIERFRGTEDQLQGWITRIAVFRARECIRRRSTRRALFPHLAYFSRASAPRCPDPVAVEALRRAANLLERLPGQERVALSLRIVDGLELTEVAAAMGISLATVKRRLSRGRQRLADLAAEDIVLRAWLDRG